MFYDNFCELCRDNSLKPTTVLRELGLSPGSLSNWKHGKEPLNATKSTIANYFDVTIEELDNYCNLSDDDKRAIANRKNKDKNKKPEVNVDSEHDELDKYRKAMLDLYSQLAPEDREMVYNMILVAQRYSTNVLLSII